MMKKLMVLSLVLAMTSVSLAGLSLTADKTAGILPGEVIQIQLVNEKGGIEGFALGYAIVPSGMAGLLSGAALTDGAGNQSSANAYTEDGFGTGYEITLADTNPGGAGLKAGIQATFMWTAPDVRGIYDVVFFNDAMGYNAPESAISLEVVPEPMTMGLLSLGALFLRRRK
ncbi:MAG: PEP-CTERM sorting domain-containing protein [Sedimentisphaerales bacterium]|nr:PEP-CTERM sorting domain-containing protein [Sedimentisphaerales bacterium]